jgi:hypothetical protein
MVAVSVYADRDPNPSNHGTGLYIPDGYGADVEHNLNFSRIYPLNRYFLTI